MFYLSEAQSSSGNNGVRPQERVSLVREGLRVVRGVQQARVPSPPVEEQAHRKTSPRWERQDVSGESRDTISN